MQKNFYFVLFLVINQSLTLYCQPYSNFESDNYLLNFPNLKNLNKQDIINSLENENEEDFQGAGSHGVVRKMIVRDNQGVSQTLALKTIIKQRTVNKLVQRIEDEVEQWMKVIDSPYVPRFYACFQDKDNSDENNYNTMYIIQEKLNHDLDQSMQIDQNQNQKNIKVALPQLNDRLKFYAKLFRVLHDIHQRNFVHNDIKPGNIMVGENGYLSDPYLIDFGLSESTNYQPINSTPCYEYKGKLFVENNTPKFDVFSMGVTLIELENPKGILCKLFGNNLDGDYDSFNITRSQNQAFESSIKQILGVDSKEPPVNKVSLCQDLNCVILFTVQRFIDYIPNALEVAQTLENISQNSNILNIL